MSAIPDTNSKAIKRIDKDDKRLPEDQKDLPMKSDDYKLRTNPIDIKDCPPEPETTEKEMARAGHVTGGQFKESGWLTDSWNQKNYFGTGYPVQPHPVDPSQDKKKEPTHSLREKKHKRVNIHEDDYNENSLHWRWGFREKAPKDEMFRYEKYLLRGYYQDYELLQKGSAIPLPVDPQVSYNFNLPMPTFKEPSYRS